MREFAYKFARILGEAGSLLLILFILIMLSMANCYRITALERNTPESASAEYEEATDEE